MYTYANFHEVDYDLVRKCVTDGMTQAKSSVAYKHGENASDEETLAYWTRVVSLNHQEPNAVFTVGYYNGDPIAFTSGLINGTTYVADIGFWANINGTRSYVTRVEWWHTFTDWLKEQGYTELQMPVYVDSTALRCYEIISTKIKYEAEIEENLDSFEKIKTFRVYLGD